MSIILRDYTEKDFEAYSRLKMDAETMYYLQDIQLHSVEEARRDFAEVLSDMKSPERKFYFCHMELKDTHEHDVPSQRKDFRESKLCISWCKTEELPLCRRDWNGILSGK